MSLLPHASGCTQHPLRDTDLVVSSCAQQDDNQGARRRYEFFVRRELLDGFQATQQITHGCRELAGCTNSSVGVPGMRAPVSTPEQFLCPITLEIMRDPVVASDEHTCKLAGLAEHLHTA